MSKTELIFTLLLETLIHIQSVAKNHVNGSHDLYLGTPGRRGEIHKKANGTTHTSVLLNNAHYAEKVARDAYKKENPDATQAEIDAAAEAYKKSQTDGKGDTGALVADHISYAGNLTQEVHGDDCKCWYQRTMRL